MNKLTIPAILAATVLVAGMFAFMPVQQASTVHTQVLAGTALPQTVFLVAESTIGDVVAANQDSLTFTCDEDWVLLDVFILSTHNDVADDISIGAITNMGFTVTPIGTLPDPGADADFADSIGTELGQIGSERFDSIIVNIDRDAAGGAAAGDTLNFGSGGVVLAPQTAICSVT